MPISLYFSPVETRFFGYGAPLDGYGSDGQFYVDIATGIIYGNFRRAWKTISSILPNSAVTTPGVVQSTPFIPSTFPIFMYGNMPPSADIGTNGQVYADTIGGGLYGRSQNRWYLLGTFGSYGTYIQQAPLFENFPVSFIYNVALGTRDVEQGQLLFDSMTGDAYVKSTVSQPAVKLGSSAGIGAINYDFSSPAQTGFLFFVGAF